MSEMSKRSWNTRSFYR